MSIRNIRSIAEDLRDRKYVQSSPVFSMSEAIKEAKKAAKQVYEEYERDKKLGLVE